MRIASISDVHIKESGDEPYNLLISFLENEQVKSCNMIIFLGDIFDLLVGSHDEYKKKFDGFFRILNSLLDSGKKILFFEGNHDFNCRSLIENIGYSKSGIKYNTKGMWINCGEKLIYFSHGDDIEIGNLAYKFYRALMGSALMNFISNNIASYELIDYIGKKASKKSRLRNEKRYISSYDDSDIRLKFRNSAARFYKKYKPDIIVTGHSHCQDDYTADVGFSYLNNGYAPASKKFVYCENGSCRLENIL